MVFEYKKEKSANINLLSLKGELVDKNQASNLLKEVEELIEQKENKFVLNLADLKYVNSSGLNVLINILTKARKAGGDIAITNPSKKVSELLIITKLNTIFNVAENVDVAVTKLK